MQLNIPVSILQPLAENAIKHGMRSNESLQLCISIYKTSRELTISVSNNGTLATKEPLGIGNANIKKRLELLYGSNACFSLSQQNGIVYSTIKISV